MDMSDSGEFEGAEGAAVSSSALGASGPTPEELAAADAVAASAASGGNPALFD